MASKVSPSRQLEAYHKLIFALRELPECVRAFFVADGLDFLNDAPMDTQRRFHYLLANKTPQLKSTVDELVKVTVKWQEGWKPRVVDVMRELNTGAKKVIPSLGDAEVEKRTAQLMKNILELEVDKSTHLIFNRVAKLLQFYLE